MHNVLKNYKDLLNNNKRDAKGLIMRHKITTRSDKMTMNKHTKQLQRDANDSKVMQSGHKETQN